MIETIKNLAKAFIGESMARNRYTMYAEIAEKEGYPEVAKVFLKTADQEKLHAKTNFMLLKELAKETNTDLSNFIVETEVPTALGSTKENLEAAIAGETYEYTEMYPTFAETAEKEGYPKIAIKFKGISTAEKNHSEKYRVLLEKIK
ncbi:MAG: rubrerythrin family protein [Candidatus Odinarchaeia archaeon]